MKQMMVRYKVKADRAAENEGYIAKVFEQLEREKPEGLRYASFKLDDGVSFVHLVAFDGERERSPLNDMSAFKEFTAGIKDRCEELPVSAPLKPVGSYRFFAG